MKKINRNIVIIIVFVMILGSVLINSCSKDTNEIKINDNQTIEQTTNDYTVNKVDEIMIYYYQQHQKNNNKGPAKWWKWLVAHAGVGPYFFNGEFIHCGLNLPCGECPGFCSRIGKASSVMIPVESNYLESIAEYNDGLRLFQMAYYNDSLMGITFINKDFVYNDTLNINDNFFIGYDASELFDKDSIIFLKGRYPVSYSHSDNGSTVVDILAY